MAYDELSKYNNLPTGKVVLGDTQLNSLVFPLPKSPVYHANNITFTYKKTQTVSSSGTDGTTTISLSGSDKFPVSGTLSPTVAQDGEGIDVCAAGEVEAFPPDLIKLSYLSTVFCL